MVLRKSECPCLYDKYVASTVIAFFEDKGVQFRVAVGGPYYEYFAPLVLKLIQDKSKEQITYSVNRYITTNYGYPKWDLSQFGSFV